MGPWLYILFYAVWKGTFWRTFERKCNTLVIEMDLEIDI